MRKPTGPREIVKDAEGRTIDRALSIEEEIILLYEFGREVIGPLRRDKRISLGSSKEGQEKIISGLLQKAIKKNGDE